MLLSAMGLSAQMYVGLGFGYHMAATTNVFGTSMNAAGDESNIYGSQGAGILPDFRFGYMLNDNWGLEFGLSYLMGSNQLMNEDNNVPMGLDSYKSETYSKSTMIRFAPQLVFKSGMGIYSRLGLYMPLGGKTIGTKDVTYSISNTTVIQHIEVEYHGDFTIGYTAALGYSLNLSDKMALFGEFQYVGMNIYNKTATFKVYTKDGVDQLPGMKTIQKEVEYVDEVLATDNTDVDAPAKVLKSASAYSSFGINVGINYQF